MNENETALSAHPEQNGRSLCCCYPPRQNTKRFNGLIWLDETGKEIIELLKTDISEEELISRLTENHHASRDAVKNAVDRFLAILNENDLLI